MRLPFWKTTPSEPAHSALNRKKMVDPVTLMSIKSLEMRSRMVVEGFWKGIHRSPFHGFSVEFSEYRQYTPGDDLRFLDWRVYARSDRYYIKKFEDETNLRCHLVLDQSKSMTFGSGAYTKLDYATTLAGTLAYFLYLQGDAIGLLTFDEAVRQYLPARNRTGHLRQVMLHLDKPAGGVSTSIEAPLQRLVELIRKRGMIILISDLLAPIELLEKRLSQLAARGQEILVFQVLDPEELNFDYEGELLLEDLEGGKEIYLDPKKALNGYKNKFMAHINEIKSLCGGQGIFFQQLRIDQPLELVLFNFLRSRLKSGARQLGSSRGRIAR